MIAALVQDDAINTSIRHSMRRMAAWIHAH
jgi:hypothetical protein